jgi:hypothetical protein
MVWTTLPLIALLAVPQAGTQPSFPQQPPDPKDMIEINGANEPWRIPQWNAWRFAFGVIARQADKLLPTDVHNYVTEQEAALIRREAQISQRNDAACEDKMLNLRARLSEALTACSRQPKSCFREKARAITEERKESEIACRWQTLSARDRVLEGLKENPVGQTALIQWVEATKRGRTIGMHKAEEAHFRLPE